MKKGFTILELLVVIAVLVILIGITIPRFKGMQDAGKLAKAKAELATLQTAIESYYMNVSPNAYPANSATIGASTLSVASPKIIDSTPPYDPFGATTTTEYLYAKNGSYYVISSVGVNSGTAPAITSTGTVTTNSSLCVTNGTGC